MTKRPGIAACVGWDVLGKVVSGANEVATMVQLL